MDIMSQGVQRWELDGVISRVNDLNQKVGQLENLIHDIEGRLGRIHPYLMTTDWSQINVISQQGNWMPYDTNGLALPNNMAGIFQLLVQDYCKRNGHSGDMNKDEITVLKETINELLQELSFYKDKFDQYLG